MRFLSDCEIGFFGEVALFGDQSDHIVILAHFLQLQQARIPQQTCISSQPISSSILPSLLYVEVVYLTLWKVLLFSAYISIASIGRAALRQYFKRSHIVLLRGSAWQFGDSKEELLLGFKLPIEQLIRLYSQDGVIFWIFNQIINCCLKGVSCPKACSQPWLSHLLLFICISFHIDLEVQANNLVVASFFLYFSCFLLLVTLNQPVIAFLESPFIWVMLLCAHFKAFTTSSNASNEFSYINVLSLLFCCSILGHLR